MSSQTCQEDEDSQIFFFYIDLFNFNFSQYPYLFLRRTGFYKFRSIPKISDFRFYTDLINFTDFQIVMSPFALNCFFCTQNWCLSIHGRPIEDNYNG